MMPFSGLAITEAASRKVLVRVTVVPPSCTLTGLGLFPTPAFAVVFLLLAGCTPVPVLLAVLICCTTVSLEPDGNILSVSCRMSLMFWIRVFQKSFLEMFLMVSDELLLPELPVTTALLDELEPTCVVFYIVPSESRTMFT